jgi:predicted nuclease of predicted toxin-antitoxin system
MRFHLDEHIHPAIAAALRRRGIDVTTTNEAGLNAAPDTAHIDFACDQARVIVTSDADFLALTRSGVHHRGIVWCNPSRTIGQIVEFLLLVDACLRFGGDGLVIRFSS